MMTTDKAYAVWQRTGWIMQNERGGVMDQWLDLHMHSAYSADGEYIPEGWMKNIFKWGFSFADQVYAALTRKIKQRAGEVTG